MKEEAPDRTMWRNRFVRGFGPGVWQITDDDDILSVFFSSKCSLFHNFNIFGSCIIHILYTGCAKFKKKFRRQILRNRNSEDNLWTSLTVNRRSLIGACKLIQKYVRKKKIHFAKNKSLHITKFILPGSQAPGICSPRLKLFT